MAVVFEHYAEPLAQYLAAGFHVQSGGQSLSCDGVRSRFDLHDTVSETFRRAFEERARLAYDGLAPYGAYLCGIARNLVIDRLRSQGRLSLGLDDAPSQLRAEDRGSAEPPSPESCFQRAEVAQLVAVLLETLDGREREFVRLRYDDGRPQEEVAAALGVTRRWVRDREAELRHP